MNSMVSDFILWCRSTEATQAIPLPPSLHSTKARQSRRLTSLVSSMGTCLETESRILGVWVGSLSRHVAKKACSVRFAKVSTGNATGYLGRSFR